MESLSLGALRAAIINEASIDGQTGANGRHPVSVLNAMINRYCRDVRGIAADAGAPWYQKLGDVTDIPAPVAGEDFIEVPFPDDALEILGVDVLAPVGGYLVRWRELDPADWTQRRLLNRYSDVPRGRVGWWAVKDMPDARGDSEITPGTIALFPAALSGSYRVTWREQFTDMTDDAHLFVGIAPMFTWVINSCALQLIKRDNNKKATFAAAQAAVQKAEERILKATKRVQSAGAIVPKRTGGELF